MFMIEGLWANKQTMGNTGLGKHKDVHSSDSTLEFETGKKMFPSEQEAKMILSGECHWFMYHSHSYLHPSKRTVTYKLKSLEYFGRVIHKGVTIHQTIDASRC